MDVVVLEGDGPDLDPACDLATSSKGTTAATYDTNPVPNQTEAHLIHPTRAKRRVVPRVVEQGVGIRNSAWDPDHSAKLTTKYTVANASR